MPLCGDKQLHAHALFTESQEMIEHVDHLVESAINSLKPLTELDPPAPT